MSNEAYKRACKDGIQTVSESRVMILGHYGAGKTSLLRCLLGEPFVKEHIPTTGIDADPDRTKVDVDITKTQNWTKHNGKVIKRPVVFLYFGITGYVILFAKYYFW